MKKRSKSLALVALGGLLGSALACSPGPEPPPEPVPGKSGSPASRAPKLVIKEGDYGWSFSPRKAFIKEKAGKTEAIVNAPSWKGEFTIHPDGTVTGRAASRRYEPTIHCQRKPLEGVQPRFVPVKSTLALTGRVRGLKLVLELRRQGFEAPYQTFDGKPADPCPHGARPEGAKTMELVKRAYGGGKKMEITVRPSRTSRCAGPDWGEETKNTDVGIENIQYDFEMCPAGQ